MEKIIILSDREYGEFTRWLLGHADLKGWTQYERAGWRVTALFIYGRMTEALYTKGRLKAVSAELWQRFRPSTEGRLTYRGEPELQEA